MKRAAFLLACLALASCADSKLNLGQRAHVRCMETGRGDGCPPDVMNSWLVLERQCLARTPAVRRCSAAFDEQYWCRTKKRVEKITNAKGETVTKETTTEYGPGCMDSYEKSKLKDAYKDRCLSREPPVYDIEDAHCSCGDYSCSLNLPFYTDSVVLKYFPELK